MELVILPGTHEHRVEATARHDARATHEHCRSMDKVAIQHIAKDVADPDEGITDYLRTPMREGAE